MGWSIEIGASRLKDFIAERCRSEDWKRQDGNTTQWRCPTHHYAMYSPGKGTLYQVIHRAVVTPSLRVVETKRFIAVDLIQWYGGRGGRKVGATRI